MTDLVNLLGIPEDVRDQVDTLKLKLPGNMIAVKVWGISWAVINPVEWMFSKKQVDDYLSQLKSLLEYAKSNDMNPSIIEELSAEGKYHESWVSSEGWKTSYNLSLHHYYRQETSVNFAGTKTDYMRAICRKVRSGTRAPLRLIEPLQLENLETFDLCSHCLRKLHAEASRKEKEKQTSK